MVDYFLVSYIHIQWNQASDSILHFTICSLQFIVYKMERDVKARWNSKILNENFSSETFRLHDFISTLQEEKYHTSSVWVLSLNILTLLAKHKAIAQTYIREGL